MQMCVCVCVNSSDFFRYAEMPTSDINSDVFVTFEDLLKTHFLVFWDSVMIRVFSDYEKLFHL